MMAMIRDWLLGLLGSPRPVVIKFDASAVAHARPGDVLVFTTSKEWSLEMAASMKEQLILRLREAAPGVVVCINSPQWRVTVFSGGAAPALQEKSKDGC